VVFFGDRKLALVVHREMTMLAALQHAFVARGYTVVVARDLPAALLAITQHYFEAALVSANLAENGDGFPLAGIIQRIFPEARVSVIALTTDVPELLSAINSGVHRVLDSYSGDADSLVGEALSELRRAG
jgi:ActR/RegA family two-component response regulator